jgi:hypothetical protein
MSRFTCCLIICVWTAATLSVAAPADGDTRAVPSADSILLTASADRFNSGELGSNASLDWIHHSASLPRPRRTHTLGLAVYSAGDSRWSFGKLGAAYPLNDRITVQGQGSVGGGKTAGNGFGYQVYDNSVTAKVDPHFYFRLGHQFYRIAGSRSYLLKPGLVLVPTRRVQADLTYAHSALGNIGSQFFSGRIDFATRAVDWLGGLSWGDSTPGNLNLEIESAPRAQKFHDVFVGVSFRLPQSVLTVTGDFLDTEPSRRRSLTIAWKVPIGTLDRGSHGN